ncbi:MAG: TonB family protein [Rhodocyclaceae bacterium]|nr:TonB family protein [Rhodocyclaceae bacterium]
MRLLAALAMSCGMHATVMFLPYLGGGSPQPAAEARPAPPPALTATLIAVRSQVASARVLPPATAPTAPPAPAAHEAASAGQPAPESGAGLDILPLPAPTYYTTDQLTKRPQPLNLADLDTPETKAVVASGKLVLKLWIDDRGQVADAVVERSDLPENFSRAAVAAFKNSRFAPGERGGLRVGTVMRIEVSYDDSRAPSR